MSKNKIVTGYKFLTPYGSTIHYSIETFYPLPQPGEKWGPWFKHPNPSEPDGKDCGPGRWHVMKHLSAQYAPANWWPWFAQCRRVLGESHEKMGVVEVRLRRISCSVFERCIRIGYCQGAYLWDANLWGANLRGANLRGANLRDANLWRANLRGANLRDANLWRANLWRADLRGADLRGADLLDTHLRGADLRGADLRSADLRGADLRGANLRGADLDHTVGLEK